MSSEGWGVAWSDDELELVKNLRLSGHTYNEISRRLNRSEASIKSLLLRKRIMATKEARHATMLRASVEREAVKRSHKKASQRGPNLTSLRGPVSSVKVPAHVIDARDRRANEPRAGGGMQGEPPFSQSALARPPREGLVQSRESLRG